MKLEKNNEMENVDIYDLLQVMYDHFNTHLFTKILKAPLPKCVLTLQRYKNTMGYFSPDRWCVDAEKRVHEIALNPSYFATYPLLELMQTLVHEQCHLWQFKYGKNKSLKAYHNKEWANAMISLGLYPSNTGRPGGKITGQKMSEYVLKKGCFLTSCRNLVANDFRFSWADVHSEIGTEHLDIGILETLTQEEQNILAVPLSKIFGNIVIKKTDVQIKKRKSKSKYSCYCTPKLNVWGKEGLNITCNECGELFYIVDVRV